MLEKIRNIASKVYGAAEVTASPAITARLAKWDKEYPGFPVCVAKTQMSFSTNAALRGAPEGHTVEVREVRVANGAGFVVAICGDMMTMPGLPKHPAAERIDVSHDGIISGLF